MQNEGVLNDKGLPSIIITNPLLSLIDDKSNMILSSINDKNTARASSIDDKMDTRMQNEAWKM